MLPHVQDQDGVRPLAQGALLRGRGRDKSNTSTLPLLLSSLPRLDPTLLPHLVGEASDPQNPLLILQKPGIARAKHTESSGSEPLLEFIHRAKRPVDALQEIPSGPTRSACLRAAHDSPEQVVVNIPGGEGGHASNMDVASNPCPLAPSTDPPALSMKAWRSDAGTLSMFLILVSKELRTSSDPLPCRGGGQWSAAQRRTAAADVPAALACPAGRASSCPKKGTRTLAS